MPSRYHFDSIEDRIDNLLARIDFIIESSKMEVDAMIVDEKLRQLERAGIIPLPSPQVVYEGWDKR